MESTVNKIFLGKADSAVHDEFVKFSRGVFPDRYLIEAKKQKDKWVIKTGNEFANFFVRKLLEKHLGKVQMKGVIVATFDVSKEAKFEISNIKQFMGIKQAVVDSAVESKQVIELMDKFPKAFYALSFSIGNDELKIKPKAPKSAKPSTKGESEAKIDFCSLKTGDENIIKDLFFDFPNFDKISVSHAVQIDSIEIHKGVENPVEMREKSIRKGKIIRKIIVDGKEAKKEASFEI